MNKVALQEDLGHRDKMMALEEAIQKELSPIDVDVNHHYAHGTYTRELHLPKGAVLTGKIHRYSCINILAKGAMMVVTDEGEYTIEAPYTFVSGPGVKKAGVALEDSIWINVHPWDGPEDLELIEHDVIIPSYALLDAERQEQIEDKT